MMKSKHSINEENRDKVEKCYAEVRKVYKTGPENMIKSIISITIETLKNFSAPLQEVKTNDTI